MPPHPPERPGKLEERLGCLLFRAFAPPSGQNGPLPTPPELGPAEELVIPRRHGGALSATFYPATTVAGGKAHGKAHGKARGKARGGVLLLHPWLAFGKAYFHRRGRIAALREAGYHVFTPDLPGFGTSPRPTFFFDQDLEDALAFCRDRLPGLPVHLWGVSSGGYWSHPLLARDRELRAAVFEDVSPHLLEWSWRMAPWGRPFYLFYRVALRRAYRYLDMRHHAAAFRGKKVLYVGGDADPGIPAASFQQLAAAAGAELLLVPGAEHLQSIKQAQEQILAKALALFARAEAD